MALDRVAVAAQIRDHITAGHYKVGDKLPSYRALGRTVGAAPNTVGEAIRLLAAEGLVSLRQNAPAVVRSPDGPDAPTPEEKLGAVRGELTQLRADIRDARTHLNALDKRATKLLEAIDE